MLLIPILIISLLILKNKKEINNKTYKKTIIISTIILFITTLFIGYNIFFLSGWDVGAIRIFTDYYIKNGNLQNQQYLTMHPNNLLLTFIYIIIKLIFRNYKIFVFINCIFITISGLLTSLTIKNITKNNKISIIGFILFYILIGLSPWTVIPYSDTYSLLPIILIIYLYTKENKNLLTLFIITFIGTLGFFIKPTIIIPLIAITILEMKNIKKINIKKILIIILAIILPIGINIGINIGITKILKYSRDPNTTTFNWKHYLALGQNNEHDESYYEPDVKDTLKYGNDYNINKFINRIKNRNLKEQLLFFTRKTLVNYNDGTFAWGKEGSFYAKTYESKNNIQIFLKEIYYKDAKNEFYFHLVMQTTWLLILILCTFNKKSNIIMLTLIGITLFIKIFEAKARYLYCFSSIFIISASLGLNNIIKYMDNRK
jgi:hypothetical protein